MNALDIAREYLPDCADAELDYIIWNCTAFPFCDERRLRVQLLTYSRLDAAERDVCEAWGTGREPHVVAKERGMTVASIQQLYARITAKQVQAALELEAIA